MTFLTIKQFQGMICFGLEGSLFMQCIQPQCVLRQTCKLLKGQLHSSLNDIFFSPLCVSLDPTAGPSATDHSKWCLDESSLHENIKKMLLRFCGPSPLVFSDVNALYLANTAPPTAAEW